MDGFRHTIQTIRHHTPLWPLVGFVVAGLSLAGIALVRIGIRNPEVVFDRKNNPHPWERVRPHTVVKFVDVIGRGKGDKYKDQLNEKPDYRS